MNSAELATGGDDLRYEVKFAAYSSELSRVQQWLKIRPEGFVTAYPTRKVNGVYFDTFDYRAYSENLAGVSRRTKVRLRWYGDTFSPEHVTLEVKQKRNKLGWKQRYRVSDGIFGDEKRWSHVVRELRQALPVEARHWVDQNPLPVILNRYDRDYFVSADGRIRATIDSNQHAFDQRHALLPNTTRRTINQDLIVIEFKFSPEDYRLASALLANVPLRIGRHSKYMNSVRSVAMVRQG